MNRIVKFKIELNYFRLVESDQETIEDPSTDEGFSSPESQAISLDNSQQYQSSCQTLREDQSRIVIHDHEIPVEIRQGLLLATGRSSSFRITISSL